MLHNIINAGVHKMSVNHRRRMNERENAKTSDDSFSVGGKEAFDADASGYFSDVSEPFEQCATDDSFSYLDSAPFLSEDEGDYSQYPILDIGEDDESVFDADGRPVTSLTPHQRRMQLFERRNSKKTPSKVTEVIERGSDETMHGRRRERLRRQRSRGSQKSTGAVPRKLSFSPYHQPSRHYREQSESSLELPELFNTLPQRPQAVELNVPQSEKTEESDEANDIGVRSVKNYAAQINSRLRNEH